MLDEEGERKGRNREVGEYEARRARRGPGLLGGSYGTTVNLSRACEVEQVKCRRASYEFAHSLASRSQSHPDHLLRFLHNFELTVSFDYSSNARQGELLTLSRSFDVG